MDKRDLLYADHKLSVTGFFYLPGATCDATFTSVEGLRDFLSYYLNHGRTDVVGRMYLVSSTLKWPVANMRFQFDHEQQLAAAVLLATHKDGTIKSWFTADGVQHSGVELSHDSWNPENTRFPDSAYVHMPVLRHTLLEFGFGSQLPPVAASWQECVDPGWL